ncbi:MAG: hypothetical protein FIA95_03770, partial [Gemmatimonadetes bacterium]|nr:hypothetical protein [Gemmatimonadota bacterium]
MRRLKPAPLLLSLALMGCGSDGAPTAPDSPDTPVVAAGLAVIPGGSFVMGDHQGLGGLEHGNDEVPLHPVRVDSFSIGKTEVTNAQYVAFLNAALAERGIEVV